jgi:hypothetical protein
MVQLKNKVVKYLLLSGKKSINEKKIKTSFKKLNINLRKRVKNILQYIIYWSSFIFKFSAKANSSYFFLSKERIFFAIKQILKFKFFEKNLESFKKELKVEKKVQNKFLTNKKLLHFYRWDLNK